MGSDRRRCIGLDFLLLREMARCIILATLAAPDALCGPSTISTTLTPRLKASGRSEAGFSFGGKRMEAITVTQSQLAAAFTEWERRSREEPERFESESKRAALSPETYGDACAPYLIEILSELAPRPATLKEAA